MGGQPSLGRAVCRLKGGLQGKIIFRKSIIKWYDFERGQRMGNVAYGPCLPRLQL